LTRDFSRKYGHDVDFVHREFLTTEFLKYYNDTLQFGYERRKNFCIKTLLFLQNANYVQCNKAALDRNYLQANFKSIDHKGILNGMSYLLEDSIHNHLRFSDQHIIHRKGSTEMEKGKTMVIPLSMSRGSLLVQVGNLPGATEALHSCAHGAGRRLSRFDAMKYWKTVLKEKQRKIYKEQFGELLDRSGNFPHGYIQEFDFAYKDASDIFRYQPYLSKVTQTNPVVTIKYSEI
jgi:tRNA-splicing ligase RtcB/release factor H-coupled RctB family protein